jgi:hypothetical protein
MVPAHRATLRRRVATVRDDGATHGHGDRATPMDAALQVTAELGPDVGGYPVTVAITRAGPREPGRDVRLHGAVKQGGVTAAAPGRAPCRRSSSFVVVPQPPPQALDAKRVPPRDWSRTSARHAEGGPVRNGMYEQKQRYWERLIRWFTDWGRPGSTRRLVRLHPHARLPALTAAPTKRPNVPVASRTPRCAPRSTQFVTSARLRSSQPNPADER